jgi:hypothetical protein
MKSVKDAEKLEASNTHRLLLLLLAGLLERPAGRSEPTMWWRKIADGTSKMGYPRRPASFEV